MSLSAKNPKNWWGGQYVRKWSERTWKSSLGGPGNYLLKPMRPSPLGMFFVLSSAVRHGPRGANISARYPSAQAHWTMT